MKNFRLRLGLLICFVSCADIDHRADLVGSWKVLELGPHGRDNVYDSVVFSSSNSICIYNFNEGLVIDSLVMQYNYDRDNGLLQIIKEQDTLTSRVLVLKSDYMEIQNDRGSAVIPYRRTR